MVNVKTYIFHAVVEPDQMPDGLPALHAFMQALNGCDTWGHDHAEALANARKAIELYVADLNDASEPMPVETEKGTIELDEPSVAVNV